MNNQYDYIIVGAGSAGSVLANRLSADGKTTVCLLEAGPKDRTPFISIPGAFAYFMFSKKYNWRFNSTSSPGIRNGQPIFCPRGKTLGGSSAVNGMVYIRGHQSDYDHWAELGNEGWSYDDVLPYFVKSETNERIKDEYHGTTGPLYVSDTPGYYPQAHAFLDAAQQAGIPRTDDFNGENFEGAGFYQFTIRNGERCGVSRAYLKPSLNRPNLTVITDAHAQKVLFDGKQAKGVLYKEGVNDKLVMATKEVILCGGAFNSPQLLMLSGIGDAEHLKQHEINLVHELPGVGKNLQEHVDACVLHSSLKRDGFTMSTGGLLRMMPDTIKYFKTRKGKLAASITEAGAFIKSNPKVKVPDIQLHFLPLLFDDSGRDLKLMSKDGFSCHACVLRPKSRGSVTLDSNDPYAAPVIDFNFFDHPEDQKTLVDGIRQVRKIMAADALKSWRGEEMHPGSNVQSDAEILQKCKDKLGVVYHPVGTCKMGNDTLAVVDNQLRVHGVKGLRVVDASVMPTLISGNTNATTIMIAERAADLILGNEPLKGALNSQKRRSVLLQEEAPA